MHPENTKSLPCPRGGGKKKEKNKLFFVFFFFFSSFPIHDHSPYNDNNYYYNKDITVKSYCIHFAAVDPMLSKAPRYWGDISACASSRY